MRIIRLTILLLALAAIASCGDGNRHAALSKADGMLNRGQTDSALTLIHSLAPYGSLSERQQAEAGIMLARAKMMKSEAFAHNNLLDVSMSFYEQQHDSARLNLAFQYAAYRSLWRNRPDSFFVFYDKALRVSPRMADEDKATMLLIMATKCSDHRFNKNYRQAVNYARKALSLAGKPETKMTACHFLSFAYSFMGTEYADSALSFAERGIDIGLAAGIRNDLFYTSITNYASTKGCSLPRCKKLLALLPDNYYGAKAGTLANIYLNTAQKDSARYWLGQAVAYYRRHPGGMSLNTSNNLNTIQACLDLAEHRWLNVSANVVTNDSTMQTTAFQNERLKEEAELQNENQRILMAERISRQRLTIMLLLVSAAAVIGFLWRDRSLKQRYIRIKELLTNSRVNEFMADDGISHAIDTRRFEYCAEAFRHTEWPKKILAAGADSGNGLKPMPPAERMKLRRVLLECFTDFIIDLKSAAAGLNLDDIILCILCAMKLSNTEISACTAASEGAVRTRKSRLKNKLPADWFSFIFTSR